MAPRTMRAPRCQVPTCHAAITQAVEIQLPSAWEGSTEFTVLSVTVGACDEHGFDLDRRVRGLLEARSDLPTLLRVIEDAVESDLDLRRRLDARCEGDPAAAADGGGTR